MNTKIDFAAIQDINERRLAFLDDVVNHYNLNNRAVLHGRQCVYEPTPTSEGCAIGRHCPGLAGSGLTIHEIMWDDKLKTAVPDWMQEMGGVFLRHIQMLHDSEDNWESNGLSAVGKIEYSQIKDDIKYAYYDHQP